MYDIVKRPMSYCIADNKVLKLSDIEKLGYERFSALVHTGMPIKLYKYYSNKPEFDKKEHKKKNYTIEALNDNTMFFKSPKDFDDSFDCAVDLEPAVFHKNRLEAYCKYFGVEFTSNEALESLAYRLAVKLYDLRDQNPEIIVQKLNIGDPVLELTIINFLLSIKVEMAAGMEWQTAIYKSIQIEYDKFCEILNKFRIACFSTSPFLNRMWSSAYADNNSGICIEYLIDPQNMELRDLYLQLFPVIYTQQRNDFLQLSQNCDKKPTIEDLWQLFFNGLLRKSLYWCDQCEWRIILHVDAIKENPTKFFKINKVYLGNKMESKERKKIIKICKQRGIEYCGLIRQFNSFNLIECSNKCEGCYHLRKNLNKVKN